MLDAYVAEVQKRNPAPTTDWYTKVEQVRVQIAAGDRLTPAKVDLLFLCEERMLPEETAIWRAWRSRGAKVLKGDGLTLGAMTFTDLGRLSARRYAQSLPLWIKSLGRPPSW